MHMADALVSPGVGGIMLAASAGAAAYSLKKISRNREDEDIPLMGVTGAFVFAAQMLNFAIPGTGSSGHLGGGLLLAFILGPCRAFLAMAAVLLIQALFFADGGLLAYGCNLFNLGFISSFLVYPLFCRPLLRRLAAGGGLFPAAFFGAVISLQLGALGVTLETTVSGMTSLSFLDFALLMQPIHLAIGAVEGLATWAVATHVWRVRPELLEAAPAARQPTANRSLILSLAAATLVAGCLLSWLASPLPDGLEWSLERANAEESQTAREGIHSALADLQEKTSLLPDYGFPAGDDAGEAGEKEEAWPAVEAGTSLSGLLGAVLTCGLAMSAGLLAAGFRRRTAAKNG
ncbi:MAG: energy-coupling factor ABC transporter permease [Planctomycetota bacterium]|nr:energy-coupling factor ABC transporter permease [Planctomycetota bacterium]